MISLAYTEDALKCGSTVTVLTILCPCMQGYWNVLLDGRRIKTPSKEVLKVPSRLIAMAIAAEFQYQAQDYVRSSTQAPTACLRTIILTIVHHEAIAGFTMAFGA